jgi:hypothetical protein
MNSQVEESGMSELEQLIAVANRLCDNLDKAADNERKFSDNVREMFDHYSWEAYRMMNQLKEIKEYVG